MCTEASESTEGNIGFWKKFVLIREETMLFLREIRSTLSLTKLSPYLDGCPNVIAYSWLWVVWFSQQRPQRCQVYKQPEGKGKMLGLGGTDPCPIPHSLASELPVLHPGKYETIIIQRMFHKVSRVCTLPGGSQTFLIKIGILRMFIRWIVGQQTTWLLSSELRALPGELRGKGSVCIMHCTNKHIEKIHNTLLSIIKTGQNCFVFA